eukprot:2999996-Rhodomonas_salina.1
MARETKPQREIRKAQEEADEKEAQAAREAKRAQRAAETPEEKVLRRELSASKKHASEQDTERLSALEHRDRSLADDPPRCSQVDVPTPMKTDVFRDESYDSTGGGAKKQLAMGPSPGERAHERGVKFVTTASGSKFPSLMLERTPGCNPVPKELLHKPRLE